MAKRESYVEKSIELLVSLGNFENIKVSAKIGETICWESAEERNRKIDSIREDLKRQVSRDINDVLDSFELAERSNVKIKGSESSNMDVELDEDDDFDI